MRSRNRLTYRRWTRDEEARLEQLLEKIPLAVLAIKFNRSEKSIRAKARKLNCSIQTSLDHYSMRFLAASLGVDLNTVRWWVQKGYLAASPNGVKRLAISASNFAAFCQKRPDIVSRFDREVLDWLCHKEFGDKKSAQPERFGVRSFLPQTLASNLDPSTQVK